MIGDIKSPLARITKDRLVIGLDISDEFSQVSYSYVGEGEPKTLSIDPEGENICIPTKLGKYYGKSVWTFGTKAEEIFDNNEGYIISNLLTKARSKKPVEVEGRDYDPVDLIALYIKKCLSLLAQVAPLEKVSVIVITVENPDSTNIEILTKAINTIRIKQEKVFYQSYSESIFNYVIHQKKELNNHDVIICHLKDDELVLRSLKTNHKSSPKVAVMEEKHFDNVAGNMFGQNLSEEEMIETKKKLDINLREAVKEFCEGNYVSSIYLLGSAFEEQWYKESLKYMCQNRRVFLGNNLFSQGAAYGAKEKMLVSEAMSDFVFLGKDKVKSNVGVIACKEGKDTYVPLLEAGMNWYETSKECEFIIGDTDKIEFVVTPLNGSDAKNYAIFMEGLPRREKKATRVKIEMKMVSEKILSVIITDLGFGEFFPPTGLRFKSEIVLDQ